METKLPVSAISRGASPLRPTHNLADARNSIEISHTNQEFPSSPIMQPNSNYSKGSNKEHFIHAQLSESKYSPPGSPINSVFCNALETEKPIPGPTGSNSQSWLPQLSAAEQWDLEGFFQLIYSLSAASFPPEDPTIWYIYGERLMEAFFKAADDEHHLFTDTVLIAAFHRCAEEFGTFYSWSKDTRDSVFTNHVTAKGALYGVLHLVKLARVFEIEEEKWWELRRNMRMAFAEPFQNQGWVSPGSNIFQKLFKLSLKAFTGPGIKPGTWRYKTVGDLAAWRKMKEIQEETAKERTIVALGKQGVADSSWETRWSSINGDTSNNPQPSSVSAFQNMSYLDSDCGVTIPSSMYMPPRSCLREQERTRPLLNLTLRPAPYPPHPPLRLSPPPPSPATNLRPSKELFCGNSSPSPISFKFRGISLGEKNHDQETLTDSEVFSSNVWSSPYPSPMAEELQPEFGDLPDIDFGDHMDLDPWGWNGGIGATFIDDIDEGCESQPTVIANTHKNTHGKTVDKALRWRGKQLFEMTDGEFRDFCVNSKDPCGLFTE